MLTIAISSFMLLFFLFSFIAIDQTVFTILMYSAKQAKLMHYKERSFQLERWFQRSSRLYQHISKLLESVHLKIKPNIFFLSSFMLLLIGSLAGTLFFGSMKGFMSMTIIFTGLPYLWLRMRLVSMQMKNKLEFLPAVEIFYQTYVLDRSRNLRIVLHEMLQEERLTYPMKPIFEQLDRHLTTKRDFADSLEIFNLTVGHEWGRYFTDIFSIGLSEGIDVTDNLKELISDMRKAQLSDQVERNRLLEIRIANFSPLIFLSLFVLINYYLNKEQTIQYYFWSHEGRELLLEALLLIFLSFGMGVYLSMKRI